HAAVASGRLPIDRIRDAAARVRLLGASAPVIPDSPAVVEPEHDVVPMARLIAEFEVTDAARTRLGAADRIGTLVRVDTVANIAVGIAPWGPFAAAAASAEGTWLDDVRVVAVAPETPLADPASLPGPVLVIGKDLHLHPSAVDAIDALRAARDDVVTVDMGWPSADRALADIATFGASRLVGAALIDLIAASVALAPAESP
ncbi:MAG TPA: hypothetical protein VFM66_06295, partial [Agromyces sp.]|nr:hypothetical protein [Agromyces sp.]